jgi:hypothetical protein
MPLAKNKKQLVVFLFSSPTLNDPAVLIQPKDGWLNIKS